MSAVEDDTATEYQIEEETSILVNSTASNNANSAEIHNLLYAICKKKTTSETNVNKASTSAK